MELTNREKIVANIANAIAVFSIKQENGALPPNISMIDFILKTIPESQKSDISIELIDEVFEFVSGSHGS